MGYSVNDKHGALIVRPDTDAPGATVVEYQRKNILYVYPALEPEGWAFVSQVVGNGDGYSTEQAAWDVVASRLIAKCHAGNPEYLRMIDDLYAICHERSTA